MPDRWEFLNDNFKRGEPALLCEIRRRKAHLSSANKSINNAKNTTTPTSTSTSLDLHSSSSTSSPPTPPLSPKLLHLSNENEKLKEDNQILNDELLQAKQQYEQLLGLVSKYVSVNDINASLPAEEPALAVEMGGGEAKQREDQAAAAQVEEEGNNVACLKLFGVRLNCFEGDKSAMIGGLKRGRFEDGNGDARPAKVSFGGVPWLGMTSPVRESSKACN